MSNINENNEKEISVNLTHKSNFLMMCSAILFIGFVLIMFFMFDKFHTIDLFVTIFSSILGSVLLLSILFGSLSNFISCNYRGNEKKLYKNNYARNIFLIIGYSFLWSFIGLSYIFLMVLLILN